MSTQSRGSTVARPQRSDEITKRIIDLIVDRGLPPGAELIAQLEARVARMGRPGPDGAVADREFHGLICAEAGFDLARELTGLFWDVYRAAEGELGGPVSTPASTARRHQLIVDALL